MSSLDHVGIAEWVPVRCVFVERPIIFGERFGAMDDVFSY